MNVDSEEEEGALTLAALGTQGAVAERGRARRGCPVCNKAFSGVEKNGTRFMHLKRLLQNHEVHILNMPHCET
jgi:hypothetical protein